MSRPTPTYVRPGAARADDELTARIVDHVAEYPGANSTAIVVAVRRRKKETLAALRAAERAGLLRAEDRPRRARAYFVARDVTEWFPAGDVASLDDADVDSGTVPLDANRVGSGS